jgi:hypothetical protein
MITNDCKRNGTTTPVTALGIEVGEAFARTMQRHRHQEFIRVPDAMERDISAGKVIHVVLDTYAAHKRTKVREWLQRHPRWTFYTVQT